MSESKSKMSPMFPPGVENHPQPMQKYTSKFRIHEGPWLQFRFEAFNAVNHPNSGLPNLNVLSGAARPGLPSTAAHQNFGVVAGTAGSRQIQLGLKYSF